ncbi:MAG: SUMF1/EgtB/PvdO family nonheme iron enzyme [Alphaproteobacteria bacterium]|nr:SUMF1/EgtB/PvdO family nonheme iron enzyme [Alphaproteobacteria bacterium]
MIGHLALDRLRADASPELSSEERAHLDGCVRCRVEARLLRDVWSQDPDGVPELDAVSASLDATRATLWTPGEVEVATEDLPPLDPARYDEAGALGRGGMGEVVRVHDRVLGRDVAMKVAHPRLQQDPAARARFLGEARVGAQLEHPGVVPVHDLGRLPDGSAVFTMMEVTGRTLREVLAARDGWPVRRLVEVVRRVAETVAYAHARGVVHRDLKPDNVMLGAFGEVHVLDWGLARVVEGGPDTGRDEALATRAGAIAGTPAYMAPEQARGEGAGPPADVHALGVVLFEVLTGRTPHQAVDVEALVARVASVPAPRAASVATVPDELDEVCARLLAPAPEARPGAQEVAGLLGAWLDGVHRRERAVAALDAARAHGPEATAARQRARSLRGAAEALLAALPGHASEEDKAPGWTLLDEAVALEATARAAEARLVEGAHAALAHDPDLAEAHALLADDARARHVEAEALGDAAAAGALEVRLRAHDRGRHAAYLDGRAPLVLRVDPPGATVEVRRYGAHHRRLVDTPTGEVLTAPVQGHLLPHGSYLLVVSAPGRETVRLPVRLERDTPWDAVVPGGAPWTLRLPEAGALGAGDCLVPGGWFACGGDLRVASALPARRVWVDDVVVRRDPVTLAEYLAFLDDLVAQGREEEALRHAVRERPASADEEGALLLDHRPGQGFALRPDAEGDLWDPRWPAWMVRWHDAVAYAAWRAARDGLPWRLPWELEWEKAARGVDGRAFPWGDHADPVWAAVEGSRPGRPMPAAVGDFPVDASPYGVRGTVGNVCDWCADVYRPEGPRLVDARFVLPEAGPADVPQRVVRGGLWSRSVDWGRASFRVGWDATDRRWGIGFRLARTPGGP